MPETNQYAAFALVVGNLNRLHRLEMLMYVWKQAIQMKIDEAWQASRLADALEEKLEPTYDLNFDANNELASIQGHIETLLQSFHPRFLFERREEFVDAAQGNGDIELFTPAFKACVRGNTFPEVF